MTGRRAWLIDVYGTLVSIDVVALWGDVALRLGLPPADFRRGAEVHVDRVMSGRERLADAFRRGLLACGVTPSATAISEAEGTYLAIMRERATLFDDAVEFMRDRVRDGDPIALVSNCAEDTRPLLAALGVAELTEVWVLSCEVGVAKPDRAIFDLAVSTLGVRPDDAVFVDDDPDYCAGARSVGITSVLLSRHADADATQHPTVRSFSEITAALGRSDEASRS